MFCVFRVGEASNPGPIVQHPGLILGAVNPTGLPNKSASLLELPIARQTIWGVSESHLTRPGVDKFKKELTFRQ